MGWWLCGRLRRAVGLRRGARSLRRFARVWRLEEWTSSTRARRRAGRADRYRGLRRGDSLDGFAAEQKAEFQEDAVQESAVVAAVEEAVGYSEEYIFCLSPTALDVAAGEEESFRHGPIS
jgi:hypothetical protein